MSLDKRGKEMLSRIGKEIASEITARKKDPEFRGSLDRVDCINKLASILDLEFNEVSDMLELEISKYLKASRIF